MVREWISTSFPKLLLLLILYNYDTFSDKWDFKFVDRQIRRMLFFDSVWLCLVSTCVAVSVTFQQRCVKKELVVKDFFRKPLYLWSMKSVYWVLYPLPLFLNNWSKLLARKCWCVLFFNYVSDIMQMYNKILTCSVQNYQTVNLYAW